MFQTARLGFSVFLASLLSMTLAGCVTNTTNNLNERGEPASKAEIEAHFSGKTVLLGKGGTYYAADGTLNALGPEGTAPISIGSWDARGSTAGSLCLNQTWFYEEGEQTKTSGPSKQCFFVWIEPDGSGIVDPVGAGSNSTFDAPVAGFPIEARFNAVRRDLGI